MQCFCIVFEYVCTYCFFLLYDLYMSLEDLVSCLLHDCHLVDIINKKHQARLTHPVQDFSLSRKAEQTCVSSGNLASSSVFIHD